MLGKFFGTQKISPLFIYSVSGGTKNLFGEENGVYGGGKILWKFLRRKFFFFEDVGVGGFHFAEISGENFGKNAPGPGCSEYHTDRTGWNILGNFSKGSIRKEMFHGWEEFMLYIYKFTMSPSSKKNTFFRQV